MNNLNIAIDASFTPKSEYILSGSSNGKIMVYKNNKHHYHKGAGEPRFSELKSMQPEAIVAVEMNPKYTLLATASSYVAFWAPTLD